MPSYKVQKYTRKTKKAHECDWRGFYKWSLVRARKWEDNMKTNFMRMGGGWK